MSERKEKTLVEEGIESGITKRMIQEDRNKPNEYRVSELVYCKRKPWMYRKFKQFPRVNGRMLSGTLFHELIPAITKDVAEFKDAEYEKELVLDRGEYTIKGHCDAVTKDCMYEFKFTKRISYTDAPTQYLLQTNMYSGMEGVKKYEIVLVNSETLQVQTYKYDFDADMFNHLLEDIDEIHKSTQEHKVPAGPRYDWECNFCDVAEECFKLRGKHKEWKELMKVKNAIKWKGIHSRKNKRVVEDERREKLSKLARSN